MPGCAARAKAVRLPLTAAISLGSCGGLLLIVQAWLLGHVVNLVVIDHLGLAAAWPYLWAMLAVFVRRSALRNGLWRCWKHRCRSGRKQCRHCPPRTALQHHVRYLGAYTIAVGVVTCWAPGMLMLTGRW